MLLIYDVLARLSIPALKLVALFSPKMRKFVDGRREVFNLLALVPPSRKKVWFHAASLGEYEQGLPLMEAWRERYPEDFIVLTFFSPSGYEVRKHNKIADLTLYLPVDTRANAVRFVRAVSPEKAFFIKYEFWPNYLRALQENNVRVFLVSGIFRPDQVFFKWYGGFYRNALNAFEHFFVQNESSRALLSGLKKHNATVSGDTRFDRVAKLREQDNSLGFAQAFAQREPLLVAGSTWPKDEALLSEVLNRNPAFKTIIAPHNIKREQIENLQKSLSVPTALYSERDSSDLEAARVLIIDHIGLLTKIYSYAHVAYVGGGFGQPGVHNVLEPATFGVPVIIGPNYSHFAEAVALVHSGGIHVVRDAAETNALLNRWMQNEDERAETGHIGETFVQMNKNATSRILNYFENDDAN